MRLLALTLCLASGLSGTALATEKCKVPMAHWQPREFLKMKLQADGWQVRSIKLEDGCYEAHAINAEGRKVQAFFDPQTFQNIDTKEAE